MSELRKSLADLHSIALGNFSYPKDMGSAVIPAAISLWAGVPIEGSAKIGAIGALVAKLYEFTIGRKLAEKQLLRSCNWSVLVHLENAVRKSSKQQRR